MTKLKTLTSTKTIKDAMKYIIDVAENIPFGNSDFQNKSMINSEMSVHRGLRTALLRIQDRLNALKEAYYKRKHTEIKIERLNREIKKLKEEKPENYDLDIQEKEIEIDKIMSGIPFGDKLIKDAIQEIKVLSPVVEKMGKISREDFEKLEEKHFVSKAHHLNIPEKTKMLIGYENGMYDDMINQGHHLLNNKVKGKDGIR